MSTSTSPLANSAPALIRIFDHFSDAQLARSALLDAGFAAHAVHAVQLDTVDDEAVPVHRKAAWRGMSRLVVAIGTPQEQERAHAIVQACNGCDIEQRTARRADTGAGIHTLAG